MASTLKLRTIVVNGRRTSIRLEPDMWQALEEIGEREDRTINEICSAIAQQRPDSTLTAAVRVFIMAYFRDTVRTRENTEPSDRVEANPLSRLEARFAADIVQKSVTESGDNLEEKIHWTLDAIPKIEQDGLDAILFHWIYLHSAQRCLPELEDIDHGILQRDTFKGRVNLIDVSSENPRNFIVLQSSMISNQFWGGNMSNRTVADYPFPLHAKGMQTDFDMVKALAFPAYHTLRHKIGDARRHYARVVLPLSRDGRTVDRLITIARPITAPQITH